jgi:osmotically-inducible protein OsmY
MSALLTLPSKPETTDQQLARRIQRQLSADSRAVSRLHVTVEDGTVTLQGVATSFYQKQLWIHGTKRVIGDSGIINDEIDVTSHWDNTDFAYRD